MANSTQPPQRTLIPVLAFLGSGILAFFAIGAIFQFRSPARPIASTNVQGDLGDAVEKLEGLGVRLEQQDGKTVASIPDDSDQKRILPLLRQFEISKICIERGGPLLRTTEGRQEDAQQFISNLRQTCPHATIEVAVNAF